MVFSITQNPYSYSVNPLVSFAVCSFSALKISHLFAKQAHLLNLSKEQAQKAKKIFFIVVQLSAAISVVYPTGSAVGFIALSIVSIAASRYFQTLTSSVAHIGETEDPLVRFKILDDLAKSRPLLHFTAQTEKAKIINDHPETPTLNYFASFDEMIQFAKTYEISKLNLSAISLNEDQIEMLTSQLPNLTHLNIHHCRLIKGIINSSIDDLNFKKITSRLTKLTDLNISSNSAPLTSDALKTIASLKDLTHLDISYTETDNLTFQLLTAHLKKLTYLNINRCNKITAFGIETIISLTNLTHLIMWDCKGVNDTSLQAIATHLNKLTYLDLSYCSEMTSTGIQSLSALKNLSWLNLSDCKVDDSSLQTIATHLKNLTHLILWGCKGINDTSLQAITTHLKKLIHLDISCCSEMTSTGIQFLSVLSNLSQLKLSFCPKVDDTNLQTIATHLKKLTHLDLYRCSEITSVGIQSLKTLSNLSQLDLSYCPKVDDSSLQTIATHLKKLTRLNLSYCSRLTSDGIRSLKDLSNLSWLDISHCRAVDDSSLQTIAKHLKKLTYLDIDSCGNVTHAALEYFKGFEKIKIFHTMRTYS